MDSLPIVSQATSFVEYTPSNNLLPWEYTTFFLDTDTTITFTDKDGNETTLVSLSKGYHPILVQKITAVTAGKVYIMRHSKLSR